MEAYPQGSLTHNHPFIVLSGLSSEPSASEYDIPASQAPIFDEDGPKVTSEFPSITSETADRLRDCFLQEALRESGQNDRTERTAAPSVGFKVKIVGRTYRLPTRKANLEKVSQWISPDPGSPTSSQNLVLHSPISPLSPSSPLFPDGFMTPLWITKHQDLLPSAFISFYNLTADSELSSTHDSQLKNDILKNKQSLASSSTRSRYIVALLSEASVLDAPELDDRLANIRRATGLDPKSLFFLPPKSSAVELRDFARTILSVLQPLCIEYYRDLSKHARRKRNRGAVPQPTVAPFRGTSQTLSSQGWNVRYDFKLGVFAEFRQEMDAATRHYEGAYESLLSQDAFESIASWSPRWDEARLLADIISVRILRCLLWNKQTTSAVRRWQLHRVRMRDLVDRRGKGSANYGWEAWEARWAKTMADLLQELALLHSSETTGAPIYANPEKAIPVGERLPPWQLLHHAGYWLNLMTRHLYARQRFAEMIPEEDRMSPGQSPASQVANKSYLYDTYLCPEPHKEAPLPGKEGVSHSQLILDGLSMTLQAFVSRDQKRAAERLRFEIAKEQMRYGHWTDATQNLRSLWQSMSWRREGWWTVIQEVCWALRTCAQQISDASIIVSVEWELLNDCFTPRTDWTYDLANCLDGLQDVKSRPKVILKAGEVISFLSASYALRSAEENVGDYLNSQLVISSRAQRSSSPVALAEVRLAYNGVFKPITLRHKVDPSDSATTVNSVTYMNVDLQETHDSDLGQDAASTRPLLIGEADLSFIPGQTKIFEFSCLLREVGEIRATSVTLSMVEELFELEYVVPLDGRGLSGIWWNNSVEGLKKQKITREAINTTKVLPKPPKMQLRLLNMRPQYYAGERINVDLEILNKEDEQTQASIEVRILGDFYETPKLAWTEHSDRALPLEGDVSPEQGERGDNSLPGHQIGKLDPAAMARERFSFYSWSQPMEYILEVKVLYYQVSDPDTPISKILTETLSAVAPYAATYEFSPRVHPAQWPNHSQSPDEITSAENETSDEPPKGIVQRWSLTANLACVATDGLVVEKVEPEVVTISDGVICSIVEDHDGNPSSSFAIFDEARQLRFILDIQRSTLEDRRSAALELALEVKWKRPEPDSETFSTRIPVPRLNLSGGGPRVLASVQYSSSVPGLIHLGYTIENPSVHQLTFSLAMESSEDFAFHGHKFSTLQLDPISRHTVRFNLYPTVQGKWIQPQLRVVDRNFNKTLKVIATEGMKMDKKGILIWVNADD